MSKPPERAQVMLQEVWRRASKHGEPLVIPCATATAARKLRFAMYAAVADARKDGAVCDQELKKAITGCSLRLDGCNMIVEAVETSSTYGAIADLLGDFNPATAEERGFEEAARKLDEELKAEASPAAPKTHNPYFTRKS